MINVGDFYKNVRTLREKKRSKLDGMISEIIAKTKPSQFDDKYVDPLIDCIIATYEEELEEIREKILLDIMKEEQSLKKQKQDLISGKKQIDENIGQIEAFFKKNGYDYESVLEDKSKLPQDFEEDSEMEEDSFEEDNEVEDVEEDNNRNNIIMLNSTDSSEESDDDSTRIPKNRNKMQSTKTGTGGR